MCVYVYINTYIYTYTYTYIYIYTYICIYKLFTRTPGKATICPELCFDATGYRLGILSTNVGGAAYKRFIISCVPLKRTTYKRLILCGPIVFGVIVSFFHKSYAQRYVRVSFLGYPYRFASMAMRGPGADKPN